MGFFSTLVRGIKAIAAPILGVLGFPVARTAVAAAPGLAARIGGGIVATGGRAVVAAGRTIARGAVRFFRSTTGQIITVVTAAEIAAAVAAGGVEVAGPGGGALIGGGGNGRFVRSTIVTTTDLSTGQVVRTQQLDGAPFLMNNEVRKLRTVARKLQRAAGKLPRRTVKQSLSSQLSEKALLAAIDGVTCPK